MKKIFFIFLILMPFLSLNMANAMNADVYIPEKYSEVKAGERLYFELSIKYPENNRRKD